MRFEPGKAVKGYWEFKEFKEFSVRRTEELQGERLQRLSSESGQPVSLPAP